MTGDEWGGRLLDVRRCRGFDPSTDFDLCGMAGLELDECATLMPGLAGNHLFKSLAA